MLMDSDDSDVGPLVTTGIQIRELTRIVLRLAQKEGRCLASRIAIHDPVLDARNHAGHKGPRQADARIHGCSRDIS